MWQGVNRKGRGMEKANPCKPEENIIMLRLNMCAQHPSGDLETLTYALWWEGSDPQQHRLNILSTIFYNSARNYKHTHHKQMEFIIQMQSTL